MTVRALGEYAFTPKDRQEVYGEDELVHVLWVDNMWFCSAACFRVPRAMAWSDFKSQMIDPWASADPDYRPEAVIGWWRDGEPIDPQPDDTIAGLGIGHKGLIRFRTT